MDDPLPFYDDTLRAESFEEDIFDFGPLEDIEDEGESFWRSFDEGLRPATLCPNLKSTLDLFTYEPDMHGLIDAVLDSIDCCEQGDVGDIDSALRGIESAVHVIESHVGDISIGDLSDIQLGTGIDSACSHSSVSLLPEVFPDFSNSDLEAGVGQGPFSSSSSFELFGDGSDHPVLSSVSESSAQSLEDGNISLAPAVSLYSMAGKCDDVVSALGGAADNEDFGCDPCTTTHVQSASAISASSRLAALKDRVIARAFGPGLNSGAYLDKVILLLV